MDIKTNYNPLKWTHTPEEIKILTDSVIEEWN